MSNNLTNFLIGVAGSVVASLIFLCAACVRASKIRRAKAQAFVGRYKMLDAASRKPYGGTVKIEQADAISLTSDVALLTVTAEHGNGTEDWTAVVEVLGHSRMATGFFTYRKPHDGGAVRLFASEDGRTIEEHATPHKSAPFTNLLERIERTPYRR